MYSFLDFYFDVYSFLDFYIIECSVSECIYFRSFFSYFCSFFAIFARFLAWLIHGIIRNSVNVQYSAVQYSTNALLNRMFFTQIVVTHSHTLYFYPPRYLTQKQIYTNSSTYLYLEPLPSSIIGQSCLRLATHTLKQRIFATQSLRGESHRTDIRHSVTQRGVTSRPDLNDIEAKAGRFSFETSAPDPPVLLTEEPLSPSS